MSTPRKGRRARAPFADAPRQRADGRRPEATPRRDAVAITTERLRQLILTGELEPGLELSQVRLAEMTGASTTPVREALRRLEAEGLVETRHNRRPRVASFDPGDLDGVYGVRILLEATAIAMTIAGATEAEDELIEADLATMREAGRVEDIEVWELAHRSFHDRLVAGGGEVLRAQIALMMSRSDRYRRLSVLGERPYGWTTGEAEHEEIFAAFAARRRRPAVDALTRHLARSAYSVLGHLAPEETPVAIPAALGTVGTRRSRPTP